MGQRISCSLWNFYILAKLKGRKAKLVLHLDETPFLAEPFPFELKIAVDMLLSFHFNAPSPSFLVLGARCDLLCLVVCHLSVGWD